MYVLHLQDQTKPNQTKKTQKFELVVQVGSAVNSNVIGCIKVNKSRELNKIELIFDCIKRNLCNKTPVNQELPVHCGRLFVRKHCCE